MPASEGDKKDETEAIAVKGEASAEKDTGENDKDVKKTAEELSEEDTALKEGLELAVTRLKEEDTAMHKQALDHLVTEIKSSTSSMTSVPKPLKFLRPNYEPLKAIYAQWPSNHSLKRTLADVISVLSMTMAEQGMRECLKYKLLGTQVNVSSWGHEYVRTLAGEVSEEYNARLLETPLDGEEPQVEDLMVLVDDIVPFQMQHNAEAEAVDMLMEVRQLSKLVDTPVVDERNYERVCLYLIRSASYVVDPDDLLILYDTAFRLYKSQKKYSNALRIAMKMDSTDCINELFSEQTDASEAVKKQMAFMLARNRSNHLLEDEELNELAGNSKLSETFLSVAQSMDLMAAKSPEDIYKSHLSGGNRSRGLAAAAAHGAVDSARANLASTFVNAFVNAGYCKDKLLIDEENGWIFKNKGHGMMSASASMGMLMMWNIDEGLNQIDKYFHNSENYVKAGACIAVGLVSSGVRNESDPALALLSDYLENASIIVRSAAISGLGLAYAGAQREEVKELLVDTIANTELSISESSFAALTLGLIYIGTCDEDISSCILQRLMETSDADLANTTARFLCLGLSLLFLGKGESADAVIEAVRTITHMRGKYAEITLEACAYAGTGNVLKVQALLRTCTEHLTDPVAAEHQSVAVIGLALISAGEGIGTEMTLRTFEHLLHYGELPIKRMVPLALSLLYVSNPDYGVIDQLSRLSHDQDPELSMCAIFGLGLVCAGSNNSRVAGLLRQLSEFYSREANHLFVVRIAQGLNALGKGLLGLSPFHSDRLLMNGPGMGGLLVVLHAFIDIKGTILDKYHYLLYYLTTALSPRYLATVDAEDPNAAPQPVSVRVGLAVETVGQAGRPKTITGFQTHTTPVLLGFKDRAELASSEFKSLTTVMEGIVLIERTPQKLGEAAGEAKENI